MSQVVTDPKILYILGVGRSGSTILGNILGELPGFVSVGEIASLWERLVENRLCGCRKPLSECEVWSLVLARIAEDPVLGAVDPQAMVDLQRRTVRWHHTWRILAQHGKSPTGWQELDAYARVMERVYRALAEVTGAQVIVDSTKWSSSAALLRLLPRVQPFFVHLVRDPRGLVYSRTQNKTNPDGKKMHGGAPAISALAWTILNLAAEAVRRRQGRERSILIRYEDFVARPAEFVERINHLLGERPSSSPFLDDHTVKLGCHHTVSGNPARFESGEVKLRLDDRWVKGLPAKYRLLTSAFALPLLARYRYPF